MMICRCGREYFGYPAVSRLDGKPVCSRCGTMEALIDAGFEKIEEILELIYGEGSEVDIYRDDGRETRRDEP